MHLIPSLWRTVAVLALCGGLMPVAASAADTCPERFQVVAWPGGAVRSGPFALEDFKNGAVLMTSEAVTRARVAPDANGRPAISFKLNRDGARILGDHTSGHVGEPIAFVLDGTLITAPVVMTGIYGGQGMLTGFESTTAAEQVAQILNTKICAP